MGVSFKHICILQSCLLTGSLHPPSQSCQQQRRGAWIAFTPGHRGRGCACQPPSSPHSPQCPPHACFFLFCLPWDLATDHHPPLPLSLLVILTPLGHVLGTSPAQAMNISFWKRVRRSWALGADLGINPDPLFPS